MIVMILLSSNSVEFLSLGITASVKKFAFICYIVGTMNKLLKEERNLEMIRKSYETTKDISTRKALER